MRVCGRKLSVLIESKFTAVVCTYDWSRRCRLLFVDERENIYFLSRGGVDEQFAGLFCPFDVKVHGACTFVIKVLYKYMI